MGRIHTTDGSKKIFIEDESLAVWVTGYGLVKGLRDAAIVLGSDDKIVHKCIVDKESLDGHKVRYATLAETQKVFPGYRVVRHSKASGTRANPTTAFYTVGGERCPVHYRSMSACRTTLTLSVTDFEVIANKHPGWRKRLPGCLDEIKVRQPGWSPPGDLEFVTGRDDGPLFSLKLGAKGIIGVKYIGPTAFVDIGSVHSQILETSK